MLRPRYGRGAALRGVSRSLTGNVSAFPSSSRWQSHMPNAPLDLDPSFRELFRDADMGMAHRLNAHYPGHRHVELVKQEGITSTSWIEEEESSSRGSRKSPAAEFGSRKIGAVVLSDQLQESVIRMIESAFTSHAAVSDN